MRLVFGGAGGDSGDGKEWILMLTLAIYRKDGEIKRVHELENGKDYSEALRQYEQKNTGSGCSVEIQEFDDAAVAAYLYRMKAIRKKDFRNQLYEICHSMNDLDSQLDWLRHEIDQMEDDEE